MPPSSLFKQYGWELTPLQAYYVDVLITSEIVKEQEKAAKKLKRRGYK